MSETEKPIVPEPPVEKRPKAKNMKGLIGPYKTACTMFEKGKDREIEVTLLGKGLIYRLKGKKETYFIPHGTAMQRAISLELGFNLGPTEGRIKRGEVALRLK